MRARKSRRADIRRELLAITLAVAAAGTTTAATAALDIFLKIGDIKGESMDDKHKGEIDLLAWSWGFAGPSRNSPGVPQRPVGPGREACAQSISLTKWVDSASPLLMSNAALGTTIPSGKLAVRRSEQPEDFLVITMKDVIISGISTGASGGEDIPTESVTLNFSSARVSVKPGDQKGGVGEAVEADVPGTCL